MKEIDAAIKAWQASGSEDTQEIYTKIKELMNAGETIIIPVTIDENVAQQYISDSNNRQWCGVFTSIDEVPNGAERMLASCPLIDTVSYAYRDADCTGVAFNAFTNGLFLDREAMDFLLQIDGTIK